MNRNYKLFIDDIRKSIKLIERYTQKISEKNFYKNELLQDALMRRIEIIGEASKRIPNSVRKINPQINWKRISNYRDFIAHSYFEASLKRTWIMIKEEIPELKKNVRKIKLL
ncbi:MAG: DUF86 domain-containing protein [Nanoarchaeota archaeon]|nr:DUF86 domain-containing protein [Nanoarchaeota archaeon]